MSALVGGGGRSAWRRAVAHFLRRQTRRFWYMIGKEAFPASSFAKNLSPEEFASYLLLIAAHI
jgi:hypothetical protein